MTFRCPKCDGKIKDKDYDEVFQWYECPSCGGCFMFDEILEGGGKALNEELQSVKNTHGDGRRSKIVSKKSGKKAGRVVAKAKKRAEDEAEAVRKADAKVETTKAEDRDVRKHRDELPTKQVVNILADEIQAITGELGAELDYINAQDKALTIWRQLHYGGHVPAREKKLTLSYCKEHAA